MRAPNAAQCRIEAMFYSAFYTARACKLYADVQNVIMQRVCRPPPSPTIVFNLIKPFCFTRACFNLCRGADARSVPGSLLIYYTFVKMYNGGGTAAAAAAVN